MEFEYKGKLHNTYKNERLQLTKDEGLKKELVKQYFYKPDEVLASSKLDLAYDLALMSARYEDIISNLTSEFSKAGTYPEWVIKAAEERFESIYGDDDE